MKQDLTIKQRKALIAKIGSIFSDDICGLSKEAQQVLLDDLVTAFQNRLSVLTRVQKEEATILDCSH